jgi:hypothetical protein
MNKTRVSVVLLMLVAVFTAAACDAMTVSGSGDLISETRQVGSFDSIDLSNVGEVVITQGGSESLSIETDDNIMERLEIKVQGGTLKLGFKNGLTRFTPTKLVFNVAVDDLTSLAVSGSGRIKSEKIETRFLDVAISGSGAVVITDLTAGDLKADISGSGEIHLDGNVAAQDVAVSGSGKYVAGDLCSASVTVSVSGSGDATVCATDTLDADTSGSGSINYYGRPSVNSSTSGPGKINSLGEK